MLPIAPLVIGASASHHKGNVGLDLRYERYPEAKLVLHGHNPFPAAGADLSSGLNDIFPIPAALLAAPFTLLSAPTAATVFCIPLLALTAWVLEVRDWRVYGLVALWGRASGRGARSPAAAGVTELFPNIGSNIYPLKSTGERSIAPKLNSSNPTREGRMNAPLKTLAMLSLALQDRERLRFEREDVQTLAEYALILALIALLLVGAIFFLRTQITNLFSSIGQNL